MRIDSSSSPPASDTTSIKRVLSSERDEEEEKAPSKTESESESDKDSKHTVIKKLASDGGTGSNMGDSLAVVLLTIRSEMSLE